MKKSTILLLTSLIIFSCQEEELLQSDLYHESQALAADTRTATLLSKLPLNKIDYVEPGLIQVKKNKQKVRILVIAPNVDLKSVGGIRINHNAKRSAIIRRTHMQQSIAASYENIIEEQIEFIATSPLYVGNAVQADGYTETQFDFGNPVKKRMNPFVIWEEEITAYVKQKVAKYGKPQGHLLITEVIANVGDFKGTELLQMEIGLVDPNGKLLSEPTIVKKELNISSPILVSETSGILKKSSPDLPDGTIELTMKVTGEEQPNSIQLYPVNKRKYADLPISKIHFKLMEGTKSSSTWHAVVPEAYGVLLSAKKDPKVKGRLKLKTNQQLSYMHISAYGVILE